MVLSSNNYARYDDDSQNTNSGESNKLFFVATKKPCGRCLLLLFDASVGRLFLPLLDSLSMNLQRGI